MSFDARAATVPGSPPPDHKRPPAGGGGGLVPWLIALTVLVVFNLLWALPRYMSLDSADSRVPLDPSAPFQFPVLVVHLVTGNVALVTVVLQLMPRLRREHPRIHRASGMTYMLAGVLPSSLLALVLLPYSKAPMGQMGLFCMAVLWIVTTVMGYRMQKQHRYIEHRRWMIYSFALAMGTTWGRLLAYLVTLMPGLQLDPLTNLEFANWLCWVVNLIIAWWWVDQRPRSRSLPQRAEAAR
ncbi:MAG TPA: DUF2306 domain-containing protein [Streptomyces sp.]|uniref:DUF2306 domain-containing protein n=1 Tax=Streptomyces sp. TaxID=1931 RepID=UPI002CC7A18F|nr:DUF2306 domain-containing protein [Streptomyces sp.]HWU11088.1 DUF2306 domain-containing protein [Streptomyces sp.]